MDERDERFLVCRRCNRPFRYTEKGIRKHSLCPSPDGSGQFRLICDEPWWFVVFCPGLLLEWLRIKVESVKGWLKTPARS